MTDKKWRFREDMLGHYINSVSNRTFQDAEDRLNYLEENVGSVIKVKDLLTMTGGNTNFYIQGTTEKQTYVQLAHGKVDDIKFPLVPYGNFDIEHISVDGNYLYIILDDKYNFAEINPELTDITSSGFCGYIK